MNKVTKITDILLVEDSLSDIRLTQKVFERAEAATLLHVVQDGEAALDYLHRRGSYAEAIVPDLILLDLNLPRVNGLEVLKSIKSNGTLRSIPVVILTTSANEEDVAQAYDLHANAYIRKPVKFEDFIDVVQRIDRFWLSAAVLPGQIKALP